MREIKFRAINANGEMIYGLPYTDGINETLYFEEYSNRLCWRNEKGAHCNQPYKNGTLMQYTGLKDKNGKEIYEGDIAKVGMLEEIMQVVFHEGTFSLAWKDGGISCPVRNFTIFNMIEVIGNIYESSKLLKQVDQ